MKTRFLYLLLCFLLLTGCTSSYQEDAAGDTDSVTVGNTLKINNTNEQLTLLDNKEALAADGLYYASWTAGNAEPYENSDGDTVDLYDAQLYLLLSESSNSEDAQYNMDSWLAAAKTNYEIVTEKEVSFNGQSYSLITYHCNNTDNPYSHGISAFCVFHNSAVCVELTCRENFTEDLEPLLTSFLDNCHYMAD